MVKINKAIDLLDVFRELKSMTEATDAQLEGYKDFITDDLYNRSFTRLDMSDPTECMWEQEYPEGWEHEYAFMYEYLVDVYGDDVILLLDY